ncbi:MBL fold metallo-hydrolase [Blastopirellula sp. JC732]|uniref:MBL fold metallo-hydrolase n=1 Tax=Blastopirellula sediminis TaxID=2894196 RepID=A0A9X1MN81_9BACT|nr:MBL fold metallo-hydrolase [Blastopirellula sediminis]MCC9606817.1 MBL fold metallo-hydrolase [Blastopirellula sediminis]MCC9629886.1 MBL fold metallo-hydrolase [Blastopirellula sediminis]
MFENAPFRKLTTGDLTIEGFSRAAVQTYWRVPEMKLLLDLGLQPWDFMGTPTAFVTHTHLDHVAALPVYVSRRRMMKMDPPTIYLPESAISGVQQMLNSFQRLDRGRMPCELIGVNPGDEIELSRELIVTPVATKHTVTSVGYIIWQRRRKLKPEYQDLPGDKIRDIRLSGVEVTDEYRVPKLAYLGDSRPEALDACPAFYEAETLILEMTFLAPDHRREKIHKMGHTHLDDIVQRRDQFKNKAIIAGHFSVRYNDRQIKTYVEEKLDDMLDGRLHLWL